MRTSRRRAWANGLLAIVCGAIGAGCAESATTSAPEVEFRSTSGAASPPSGVAFPASRAAATSVSMEGMMGMGMAQGPAAADGVAAPGVDQAVKAATAGRKIIYTAQVDLVTDDLNKVEAGLTALIRANKGYIADSDRTGSAGVTRRGTWRVRVPVERYDALVAGAVNLGELVSIRANSQDVSEEFFDLEARQAAKKVQETRLIKLLAEATGKLEEVLKVEHELGRIRSEIERMQGRLRVLDDQATLATVTVSASEIQGYVPPQAPTFGTRVGRTFAASVDALRQFGEGAVLFVVGIAPWLPLVCLAVLVVVVAARRKGRNRG